jgi:hypothetical protein
MKGLRQLKALWRDPNMKELIDSLWREYYGLYNEKYDRNPEKWLLNIFSEEIEFGQALGQDNFLEGNCSVAVGQGLNTKSFFETVFGAYARIAENQDSDLWIAADRLLAIGNGTDADNRSNALEVFKSGLFKLFNALVIGKFDHENELPEDGTLQFDELKLQVFVAGFWKLLLTDASNDNKPYGRRNEEWEEVAALDHDHEIGNVALLFENSLV